MTTFPSTAGSGSYTQGVLPLHNEFIEPQYLSKMYELHGGQFNTILNMFETFGSIFPVKDTTFGAWFKGWRTFYLTVKSAVSDPGVGNPATFTLTPSDHTNNGTRTYVRPGETVYIPNTGIIPVEARVADIDTSTNYAHTVKIIPVDGSKNIGALSAGTTLAFGAGSKPVGSGQGEGINYTEILRNFNLRIIEEQYGAEGHLLTQPTWTTMMNNGMEKQGIIIEELATTEFRFRRKAGLACLIGDEATNPNLVTSASEQSYRNDSSQGNQIFGSKGVLNWATELGRSDIIGEGNMVWDDFRAMSRYDRAQAVGTTKAVIFGGNRRINEMIDLVRSRNQGNGTDYTKKSVDSFVSSQQSKGILVPEGFSANFDFESMTDGRVTTYFVELSDFTDSRSFGLADYGGTNWAIRFPLGNITNKAINNMEMDRPLPTLGMAYQSNMGYNRYAEVWPTGGAGGDFTYTNDIDRKNWNYRGTVGPFVAQAEQLQFISA